MEFQEVMKQWARMCHSFRFSPNGCNGCPFEHERCYSEKPYRMDISIIESDIMSWAAEHPEPVYPSYLEVFGWGHKKTWAEIKDILANPIPADIAQKFGIEPKNG